MKESSPTNLNIDRFNEARTLLKTAYKNEQTNYLENKITHIRNSATNKRSAEVWKTVNEISGRKSTSSSKLKAKNQEERVKLWEKHFKDLLGKPPEVIAELITPIINEELNIKKGNFSIEELTKALQQTKNHKACGLDEIPAEVWKLPDFKNLLLDFCNQVYNNDPIKRWTDGCILPFPKKGDLTQTKNYRGITLTAISAKIYNLLLLNRIRPEIDPLLRKNQNGFRTNRSTSGQILTIRRIIEGVKAKNLPATLLFIDFSKAFDSIHRGKMKDILLAYGIPHETVNGIMMLYKDTRSLVRSPDGDTSFFDITAGVLQGDTLAPFIFVICLDYILRKSIDENLDLGFTLDKKRSRRHKAIKITDADYADDLALLTDYLKDAETTLHNVEQLAKVIGLYVNATKTKYIATNQDTTNGIKSLNGDKIDQVDDFNYLGSFIASTEQDVNSRLGKTWATLNKMNKIWKSTLPDNLKRNFFRATVESVLVYGSISWTLTSTLEKKIDGAYTRMLRVALNKSWTDHLTNVELYGKIPRVTSTIREQRLRFAGHCWRNKNELSSEVILWEPLHGKRSRGRPNKTYTDQLRDDAGCS